MKTITTYSFCESFLESFFKDIERDYLQTGRELSRIAIVFGGKRPALFLKRLLARKMRRAFLPPRIFSVDEFMAHIAGRHDDFEGAREMDQCYTVFQLARAGCPELLAGRESFAEFLPWAREILTFIDQLDLEDIPNQALSRIEKSAQIGYDVPEEVNQLLSKIVLLRGAYHQQMREARVYSRGFQYLRAAQVIAETPLKEFEEVLFANLFYFNRTEEIVAQELNQRGAARFFFQGDQRRWPVLKRVSRMLDAPVVEGKDVREPAFDLNLYAAFDGHSQVCQVREILKKIDDPSRAVIVMPGPELLIPLLSEISGQAGDFNISMGYPLKRSSLATLLDEIFAAQISREPRKGYYARDYLKVLRHPLIKNLRFSGSGEAARVVIHKAEELLTGQIESDMAGRVFFHLEEIGSCDALIEETLGVLKGMGMDISAAALTELIRAVHRLCFGVWEGVATFSSFAASLTGLLELLVRESPLREYPLNARIASRLFEIAEEFGGSSFAEEPFAQEEIFRVFFSKMDHEIVSFKGSPLKGLQVLGLFETRSLNFRHVIVLDVNEGILPSVNVHETLIPRDVMISLGLDRLEREEEIQRYGFMRLISSAKDVHLVYEENRERERSRFIEELIWEAEKSAGGKAVPAIIRPEFRVRFLKHRCCAQKTPEIIFFLRNYQYSASSINMYLKNPMDFYRNYVLGLREKEDLLEEPENREVGIFVHELLEDLFQRLIGRPVVIDDAFRNTARRVFSARFQEFFGRSGRPDAFFLKRVVADRLERFLDHEQARSGGIACVECLEKAFSFSIPLACGVIKCKCVVDRIDRMKDGRLLVLDYKTGNTAHLIPKDLAWAGTVPMDRGAILEKIGSVQLPLYFYGVRQAYPGTDVVTGMYDLRTQEIRSFPGQKAGPDRESIEKGFLSVLNDVIGEIVNPDIPFAEADDPGGDTL